MTEWHNQCEYDPGFKVGRREIFVFVAGERIEVMMFTPPDKYFWAEKGKMNYDASIHWWDWSEDVSREMRMKARTLPDEKVKDSEK